MVGPPLLPERDTRDAEGEGMLLRLVGWTRTMDARERHEGKLLWWKHYGCKRERERENNDYRC